MRGGERVESNEREGGIVGRDGYNENGISMHVLNQMPFKNMFSFFLSFPSTLICGILVFFTFNLDRPS